MDNKEYIRLVPGAKAAVLFIHGIVGSPNHFDSYVAAVPDGISVHNMLLEGHGKGVKDFSKASMSKWEAQVAAAVDELAAGHERIYIMAHSMGTLLAIHEAIRQKKICKLFLLSVPLKLFLKPALLSNIWKIYTGNVKPNDPVATALVNCSGITPVKNPFAYIGWIPRFIELFGKIANTRKCLKSLSAQTVAYQSARDELVAINTVKLLKANPSFSVKLLPCSRHFYYTPEEQAQLLDAFIGWLETDAAHSKSRNYQEDNHEESNPV